MVPTPSSAFSAIFPMDIRLMPLENRSERAAERIWLRRIFFSSAFRSFIPRNEPPFLFAECEVKTEEDNKQDSFFELCSTIGIQFDFYPCQPFFTAILTEYNYS